MNREEYQRVKKIFQSVIEMVPEERDRFLDENCTDDPEIRREVERLLSSQDNEYLEEPAIENLSGSVVTKGSLSTGQQFGRYEIIRSLGKGGMGEVYLAEDAELERLVAIKVLSAEVADDKFRISRFMQEAKSASASNHPNILTIYEIGEFEGLRFMATEYVDGLTLGTFLRKENPPLSVVLKIATQIVSALDAAHSKGIVHRDIKPDNIMIRGDGIVKVLDFGLAKLVEKRGASMSLTTGENDPTAIQFDMLSGSSRMNTSPGMIMGTPHYMSPEQARGKNIELQTDIFSFGVVLYEMLSGRLPFVGETPSDIIAAILTHEPSSLIEIATDLPPDLSEIVSRSMAKARSERYQSVRQLLDDIEKVASRIDFERQFADSKSLGQMRDLVISSTTADGDIRESNTTNPTVETYAIPNNLSGDYSKLIGRDAEVKTICDLIKAPEARLVTMTGVGGTGKTRLAKEIARLLISSFTDGVYFVDLSAIADSELVEQEIEHTLGVKNTSDDSLFDFLRDKRILLLLDNFEQITEAASAVGELIASCPKLKVLVTSRVRLNLSFEQEFTLQPLGVPTENDATTATCASVALFVERARAVKNGFALTEENSEAIADICRRLDGLPLAIELAAVQVKMFAPKAINKRLEGSIKILSSGSRDVPARQRTMRDAIAWSYELLEHDEKRLFNSVFVFRGGFTIESAEAVADPADELKVIDCLASLIDKSLLVQSEQADGEPRFRMLQVVRDFAREEPERTGEDLAIRKRHAEYFVELAEAAMVGFRTKDAVDFLERTETEHDNLRLAIEWTLGSSPEIALRIAGALPQFWIRRGHLVEGARLIREALRMNGSVTDPKYRARALFGLGNICWNQGNVAEAEQFFDESLSLSREIGDRQMISVALDGFGIVRMMQDDFATAEKMFEEGLILARANEDGYAIARLENCLGEVYRNLKDYDKARQHYQRSLETAREGLYKHMIQLAAVNLSAVSCLTEDYVSARETALETLKLAEEAGDRMVIGFALERFMAIAVSNSEFEKAARLFGAIDKIYESIGYKIEGIDEEFLDLYLDQIRVALSTKEFERAAQKGRSLTMRKVVELALRPSRLPSQN